MSYFRILVTFPKTDKLSIKELSEFFIAMPNVSSGYSVRVWRLISPSAEEWNESPLGSDGGRVSNNLVNVALISFFWLKLAKFNNDPSVIPAPRLTAYRKSTNNTFHNAYYPLYIFITYLFFVNFTPQPKKRYWKYVVLKQEYRWQSREI